MATRKRSEQEVEGRLAFAAAKRVVVKLGTRVLASNGGRPDIQRLRALVKDVSKLHHDGREIVLVSSGAVGMGVDAMRWKSRPTELSELQLAAAVGQTRLMSLYEELFSKEGILVGQVLLTHDDLLNKTRHLNARSTMLSLLEHKVIPIVNENDVVAVDEIKFGDNDALAALTSILIDAEGLVLLTTARGFYRPDTAGRNVRVPFLERVTRETLSFAKGKGSSLSTGGMNTKLQAAQAATRAGIPVVIAHGRTSRILFQVCQGADVGTLLGNCEPHKRIREPRKRWLAFFNKSKGSILVDSGAGEAIEAQGRSLLPIGVRRVKGVFTAGAVVSIQGTDGRVLARGLVNYSSTELGLIQGKRSNEITSALGVKPFDEVVHRNNMVLLRPQLGEV